MKCVSYNIQYGLGSDGRYDLARISREVAGAQIIALQEVDRFWQRSGMVDAPAEIARHLPDMHYVFGANLDMHADVPQGGAILHRRKQFGTMILSRWPILSSRNFPLPKWGDLKNHSIQQGILEAVVDSPLGPLRIYSVHLSHLAPFTRLPQIARIKEILSAAPAEGGAWCGGHPNPADGWLEEAEPPMPDSLILMGDMNFAPDSEEYTALIGGRSAAYGRLTSRKGLVDAWVCAGHPEASGSTHPNANTRIDHIFLSADLAHRVTDCRVDDTARGSDHWPVWCTLE